MKYILIDPTSGLTPENISSCFSNGVGYVTKLSGVKVIDFNEGDLWLCEESAGNMYEQLSQLKLLKIPIIWTLDVNSIKILNIIDSKATGSKTGSEKHKVNLVPKSGSKSENHNTNTKEKK